MKFIYTFNKEVSQALEQKGLKKINEVTIDGRIAYCYANSKEIFIGKYEKNELLLTNKLFF